MAFQAGQAGDGMKKTPRCTQPIAYSFMFSAADVKQYAQQKQLLEKSRTII